MSKQMRIFRKQSKDHLFWTWQVLINLTLNGFLLSYLLFNQITDISEKVIILQMKNLEEEERKWRIRMMMSMTSFLTISQNIFQRQNIQKRLIQTDFHNQEMIFKLIKIVSDKRTEKTKKLPIWRDRFTKCKIRISRMDFKTLTVKITSQDKMV